MQVVNTDEAIKRWGQGCDGEARVGLRRRELEMGGEGHRPQSRGTGPRAHRLGCGPRRPGPRAPVAREPASRSASA